MARPFLDRSQKRKNSDGGGGGWRSSPNIIGWGLVDKVRQSCADALLLFVSARWDKIFSSFFFGGDVGGINHMTRDERFLF